MEKRGWEKFRGYPAMSKRNVLEYFPSFFCRLLWESGGHGNHFPVHPAFCSRLRYGQNPECPGLMWEGSHENIKFCLEIVRTVGFTGFPCCLEEECSCETFCKPKWCKAKKKALLFALKPKSSLGFCQFAKAGAKVCMSFLKTNLCSSPGW